MERWAAVCGGDAVYTYRLRGVPPVAQEGARTQLQGARAVCYHDGAIFCASEWGDTLWHLDARTLSPLRVLPLGPGVNRIVCAPDGQTLYALCEDADSVMSLSLQTGQPLMLARAGLQPRDLLLTPQGLLIAGGATGDALLFCERTLCLRARVLTPGLCAGAAVCGGMLCTFSMTEQATGMLCLHDADGGMRARREINALPGGLCASATGVWALYWGGASWMDGQGERQFFMDGLAERAAAFPGGVIFCQPSTPQCLLLTANGAQALEGGSDVCVYETGAPGAY